jgi:hypothetical protein
MKAKLLLSFLLSLLLGSEASATYSVVVSKSAYTDLTGANDLAYYASDSGYYFNAGLMFRTFGKHLANFNTQAANPVSAGGFMSNSGMLVIYDSIGKKDVVVFQCFEGFKFSVLAGTTTAAYKVEGSAPNRILKCQWKNLVYNKNTAYKANFQIWLNESDGSVSYHYGVNSLPPAVDLYDGGYSGIVVVKSDGSALLQEINLEGKPTAPAIYRNVLTSGLPTLDSIPPNATVYTFKYAPNSVAEVQGSNAFRVYPNPASGTLHLNVEVAEDTKFSIYDAAGRLSQAGVVNRAGAVDVKLLPDGVYTIELNDTKRLLTDRFVKRQD